MTVNRRFLVLLVGAITVIVASAVPAFAIIHGTPAQPSEYPFFARIFVDPDGDGKGTTCGSSVIEKDTMLTAAHCVDGGIEPDAIIVFVGNVNPRRAIGLVVHPLWNGDHQDGHDLAIIHVGGDGTGNTVAVQVGNPFEPWTYKPGSMSTVVGVGRTDPDVESDGVLRAADVPIHSDQYMDDIYNPWYWFDHWPGQYAIGAGLTWKGPCHGDSGGPLLVFPADHWIQVGVASFTDTWWDDCDEPAGFAELDNAQLAWVVSQVPTVKDAWGPCTQPNGYPGLPHVNYVSWYLPGAGKDGPYYWEITCDSGKSVPEEPKPTPTEPTEPPICVVHPEKCPPG